MTHHQIILRYLRQHYPRWVPAHELVKLKTEWGFTGTDGDRRARELATNDEKVRKEWHNYVDRADGADIGEDKRFTYFRFTPRQRELSTDAKIQLGLRWFASLPAAPTQLSDVGPTRARPTSTQG